MAEATLVAEPVTQTDPTAGTPTSEATPAPASTQEQAPAGTGEDTPSTGTTPEPEAAAPPVASTPEERLSLIEAKVNRGEALSADEIAERPRLSQSVNDRRADYQKQQQQEYALIQAQHEAATNLETAYHAEQDKIYQSYDGTPLSLELTQTKLATLREQYEAAAPFAYQTKLASQFDRELLAFRSDPAFLRWMQSASPEARINEWRKQVAPKLYAQQPGDDHVVLSKAEYKKQTDAAVKTELDKWKAANPGHTPPAGTPRQPVSTNSSPSSLAEAEQMHAGLHPSGQTLTNAEMRAYLAQRRS